MRANTFVGQVIAVLSRRVPAFELDPAEPQTFPGRIKFLLSRRGRTETASHMSGAGQTLADKELSTHAENMTYTELLLGRTAVVVSTVDSQGGKVKLRGELWSARAFDEAEVLEPGQKVTVMKISGAFAVVSGEHR